MQFVPGVTLARLIAELGQRPTESRGGPVFRRVARRGSARSRPFSISAGSKIDRPSLRAITRSSPAGSAPGSPRRWPTPTAAASSTATSNPPMSSSASQYGRPFLADFNIAFDSLVRDDRFGGTLAYMAPEHLEAIDSGTPAAQQAVDARSDTYSLALVLFQFAGPEGPVLRRARLERSGFPTRGDDPGSGAAASVHTRPRVQLRPATPDVMDRLLRRVLDPDPERRFPTAAALMHATRWLPRASRCRKGERSAPRSGRVLPGSALPDADSGWRSCRTFSAPS